MQVADAPRRYASGARMMQRLSLPWRAWVDRACLRHSPARRRRSGGRRSSRGCARRGAGVRTLAARHHARCCASLAPSWRAPRSPRRSCRTPGWRCCAASTASGGARRFRLAAGDPRQPGTEHRRARASQRGDRRRGTGGGQLPVRRGGRLDVPTPTLGRGQRRAGCSPRGCADRIQATMRRAARAPARGRDAARRRRAERARGVRRA